MLAAHLPARDCVDSEAVRDPPPPHVAADSFERRLMSRSVSLEYRCILGWWDEADYVVVEARLQDIGIGGGAVALTSVPPLDRDVEFRLMADPARLGLECRVVTIEAGPRDGHLARLAFWSPCPSHILDLAIGRKDPDGA